MAADGSALYLLFKDGQVLRWLGSPDRWERIGNDGRIVSMAADGSALYLLFKDGQVLRWLGSPDRWERIGNDGRIVSMAADGSALYLLFNDGEVLRWLGSPDRWERIGNDGRIVSMAAGGVRPPQVKSFCRFFDPPGSPTLGPRSYTLKTDGARKSELQWSVNGVPRV